MDAETLTAIDEAVQKAVKSAVKSIKPQGASKPENKAGNFLFPCLCCNGAPVPAHVEASGVVVACPGCRMAVRFAAQVIRPPDADAVADKLEAAYECGRISKRAYQRAHNREVTPEPELPADAEE